MHHNLINTTHAYFECRFKLFYSYSLYFNILNIAIFVTKHNPTYNLIVNISLLKDEENAISKAEVDKARAVRLRDGPDEYSGRLEVYYNGEWGTVCADGFGYEEARYYQVN